MNVKCLQFAGLARELFYGNSSTHSKASIFQYNCQNCGNKFAAMLYTGGSGIAFCIFSQDGLSISTPHTPEKVAFYLEQADSAQAASAFAAALVMYRSALNELLRDQNFKGTLHAKIVKLQDKIDKGTAKEWAQSIDPIVFKVIKYLGDVHMHRLPEDKLYASSSNLSAIREFFIYALNEVYERPVREEEILGLLKNP
jgi:hypothetical protein